MVAPLTTLKQLFAATTRKAISYPSFSVFTGMHPAPFFFELHGIVGS
jgi:hypothetical protein